MTTDSGGKRSSPFDRMLEENQKQLDALMRRRTPSRAPTPRPAPRPQSDRASPVPAEVERSAPSSAPPLSAPPSSAPIAARESVSAMPAGEPYDISGTDIGRRLASRFGEDWRFEIVDKRRDGEDVVVWARLTAGSHDKTRRGRARIRNAPGGAQISATTGGTGFILRAGEPSAGTAEPADPEQAAFEEAASQALTACAKGL